MFELLENGNPLHPLICVAGASEICSCDCDETDFYTVMVEPGDSAPASMGRQYYDYSDGVAYFIPPGTSFRAFSCCTGAGCDWQGRALFFHRILLEGTCLEDIQDRYTFFRYRSRNEALHLSSRNMGLLQRCLDGIDWELSSCIDEYTSTLIINRLEMMLNYCLRFYRCRNVNVSGVIMRDSSIYALLPAGCDNVCIDYAKTIGMWRYNSDGFDVFNSSNITVTNCFLRNFDDCVVIKGIPGFDYRNNENILVSGCVIWCDWGRPLELGAETSADEYRNIVFEDCDIIHGSTINLDIQHHNRAKISNIVFDNIRVEYSKYQLPDQFQQSDDQQYTGTPNSGHPYLMAIPIYNSGLFAKDGLHGSASYVRFSNIQVIKDAEVPMPKSFFMGMDKEHSVSHIVIENLTVNGEKIDSLEKANVDCNEFVYDITIK